MRRDVYAILGSALLLGLLLFTFALFPLPKGSGRIKSARLGVLLALCLILGYLESFLPDFLLPGMRLGLGNAALLLVLLVYGFKEAFALALLKALLISLLRGNFLAMGGWMALAGSIASILGMGLLHALWRRCSAVGLSIVGALLHVSAQVCVGALFLGPAILGYWPWLLLSGFLTGALIGVLVEVLRRRKSLMNYLRR